MPWLERPVITSVVFCTTEHVHEQTGLLADGTSQLRVAVPQADRRHASTEVQISPPLGVEHLAAPTPSHEDWPWAVVAQQPAVGLGEQLRFAAGRPFPSRSYAKRLGGLAVHEPAIYAPSAPGANRAARMIANPGDRVIVLGP